MSDLRKLAVSYSSFLTKQAVKERFNRGSLQKMYADARKGVGALRGKYEKLQSQVNKFTAEMNKVKADYDAALTRLNQIHGSLKGMDVANADDVTLYPAGHTGYHIRGKEYHLETDSDGAVKLVPMRLHRKNLKNVNSPREETSFEPSWDPSEARMNGENEEEKDLNPSWDGEETVNNTEDESWDEDGLYNYIWDR